jgi:hypothetical protein
MTQSILFADSSRGQYIPQFFAESVDWNQLDNWNEDEREILLAGPDHEFYWETWESVMDKVQTVDGGILVTGESGDLFIVYRDKAIAALNEYIESQVEYYESHKDAGDAYAHMPSESWSRDSEKRLKEQFEAITTLDWVNGNFVETELHPAINCKGLDIDQVSDLALDNFEMVARTIYTVSIGKEFIVIDSFPIEEIEIPLAQNIGALGIDELAFEYAKGGIDSYVNDSGYAFVISYVCWYAVIRRDELQALIDSQVTGE